ncbi:hypothetical protein ACWIG5_31270 [Streptomyces lydicus]
MAVVVDAASVVDGALVEDLAEAAVSAAEAVSSDPNWSTSRLVLT